MIAEGVVLGRVEHFEQSRSRVAPPVGTELVDLVEEEDGVHGPGLLEGPGDAPRLRPHVGAPVASHLGLVPHAAQRHPDEAATQGAGHRLAQRGLAHAGRADQGQDGAGAPPGGTTGIHFFEPPLPAQLADGQVLDDALLHVVETGVVGVKDGPGLGQVEPVVGALAPGQLGQPVEPGADPGVFRALLAGALQAVDLPLDGRPHGLGHGQLLEAGAVTAGDVVAVLPQLLADGLQLLAQQELPLALLHALAHVGADPLTELQLGQRLPGPGGDLGQALLGVERLEDVDLLLEAQVGGVAGRVGHGPRVGDAPQGFSQRHGPAVLEDGLDDGPVLTQQFPGPLAALAGGIFHRLDGDPQARRRAGGADADDGPVEAAHEHAPHTVGEAAGLFDLGHGADPGVAGRLSLDLNPGDEHEEAVGRGGGVGGRLGLVALEGQWDDHLGKDDPARQGKQREGPGVDVGH